MSAARRIEVVDAVKGLAIVLVVYGHVAQGVHHRGWWDSPAYAFQERFIYSFHMAAFFFVSGLFVRESIARSGAGSFVMQRLRTVLWPYLICVLAYGAEIMSGNFATHGGLLHSMVIPALTGEASWFLPSLFLCLLLAAITNRLPVWAVATGALALNLLWPVTGIRIFDSAAHYFVFVAVGAWLNRRVESVAPASRWAATVSAAVSFSLVVLGNLIAQRDLRIVVILVGLAGTMGLFRLAQATRDTAFDRAACWCGEASLGIFVLHPFFQGATRLAMTRLTASHAVFPHVFIPTVIAVVVPGLLWHYRRKLRIGFLFVFPWGEPKRQAKAVEDPVPAFSGQKSS
jgi:fucose 4-O-acetylase-like acetyltransferase